MTRWLRYVGRAIRKEQWSTDHVVWMSLMCFCIGRWPSNFGIGVLIGFGVLEVLLLCLQVWHLALADDIAAMKARLKSPTEER